MRMWRARIVRIFDILSVTGFRAKCVYVVEGTN